MDGEPAQTDSSSYKRGQVNSALWFAFSGASGGKVPRAFARRLSKFSELGLSPTPGSGFDLEFTLRNVIELAIALDLQDVGLNQLEIVRWLLRYREVLWAGLKEMGATALYLLIRSRTILEARGLFGTLTPVDWAGATIGEPVIVKGDQQLQAELRLGGRDRKRIVIELGDLVRAVVHGLQSAPPQRRGRK